MCPSSPQSLSCWIFFPSFLPQKHLPALPAEQRGRDCALGVALSIFLVHQGSVGIVVVFLGPSGICFRRIQLSLGFYYQESTRDEFQPQEAALRGV